MDQVKRTIKPLDSVIQIPPHIVIPEWVTDPKSPHFELFSDQNTIIGYYVMFALAAGADAQRSVAENLLMEIGAKTANQSTPRDTMIEEVNEVIKNFLSTYSFLIKGAGFKEPKDLAYAGTDSDGHFTLTFSDAFIKMQQGRLEFDIIHLHPTARDNFHRAMLEKLLKEFSVGHMPIQKG